MMTEKGILTLMDIPVFFLVTRITIYLLSLYFKIAIVSSKLPEKQL